MQGIILFSVIQQLLYHIPRVESLMGQNIIPIRNGEFPFIASFQYIPGHHNFCGGALITKQHVLTIANCVENVSVENIRILFEVAHVDLLTVNYTIASWITYRAWSREQGIPYGNTNIGAYNAAIVELSNEVDHVTPVELSGLTKSRLNGKKAIMIGWNNDVLSKATVDMLSDEDCKTSTYRLRKSTPLFDDKVLCSAADPFALFSDGDLGSPLLHARDKSLLGIAFGVGPSDRLVQGNFSTEFIRQHQINIHTSVHYYRLFIYSNIVAALGA